MYCCQLSSSSPDWIYFVCVSRVIQRTFVMLASKDIQSFSLIPFAADSTPPGVAITGTVERTNASHLLLTYQLQDGLHQVNWPSIVQSPSRKHDLWKTTCLEFFLSEPNAKEYWEANLSPSGDWNVYHFDDYREGMKPESRVESLEIVVVNKTLHATLKLREFNTASKTLDLGVTAVTENVSDGSQTFWALIHTGDHADFHRRDSFIVKV